MDGQLSHDYLPPRRPVLSVDPDQHLNDRIASYLDEAGFVVDSCKCPFQAYERCSTAPTYYGLVFIEANFPVGDVGFEIGKRIASYKQFGGPGVVGMTSDSALFDPEHKSHWGMSGMILKPLFKWLVINMAMEHCGFDTTAQAHRIPS